MNDYYLLKSACWLSGFGIIYLLFLKNERFFILKRIYLITGLVLSYALPLVTFHYSILVPSIPLTNAASYNVPLNINPVEIPSEKTILPLIIYISGIIVLSVRLLWHILSVSHAIRKGKSCNESNAIIIRTEKFTTPFSFFRYILISPNMDGKELREIVNHELVHISQKHWIDLMLSELTRIVQWLNPFAWIYTYLIRINHEHLADAGALQRSADPAMYKAVLLNHMFSAPVLSLSNSFSFVLNKNRFEMMKYIYTSPYRKLKTFLIVPVIVLTFYAFSEPEYVVSGKLKPSAEMNSVPDNSIQAVNDTVLQLDVKGTVFKEEGGPLAGANITVTGSSLRGITDQNGHFSISGLSANSYLLFSATGYKTRMLKPEAQNMTIILEKNPEYNPQALKIRGGSDSALVVIDGVIAPDITPSTIRDIPSSEIASITVLKPEGSVRKYGDKAIYGAIEITTGKKPDDTSDGRLGNNLKNVPYVVVEQMPLYPGGDAALLKVIAENVVYPKVAKQNGIEGRVIIRFVVTAEGTVDDITVLRGVDPDLDSEAARAVSQLGKFLPGKQSGKPVPVYYMVPVTFTLKKDSVIIKPVSDLKDVPFVVVEEMPIYPGGDLALLKAIAENVIYPEKARQNRIEGRVIIRFVVTAEGNVDDVTVLKGADPDLDKEAVRVMGKLGKFKPGKQGGKPVPVYYMVPVNFTLKKENHSPDTLTRE